MRRLVVGSTVLLAICHGALAFNKSTAALQEALTLFQSMPACAQECTRSVVAVSKCSPIDIECTCNDAFIKDEGTSCLKGACTVREQLVAANITDQICQRPVRDRASEINYAVAAALPLAILAYVLRMTSKVHFVVRDSCSAKCLGSFTSDLAWDDAIITLSLVFVIPLTVLTVPLLNTDNKVGHDIWWLTPTQINFFMHVLFHAEYIYVASLATIKISMLCSYLRFFFAPLFRKAVFVGIAANIVYFLAFALLSIFQCTPVSLSWERWEKPVYGQEHCLNFNILGWTSAGINIVLDFYVVLLPMPMIWSMSLNKRKKILISIMFGVGLFVTLISILRLESMVHYGKSDNVTWDYVPMAYWTLLELHVGFLCTSMPSIRNILRRFVPYLMGIDLSSGRRSGAAELSGRTVVNSQGHRSVDTKGEFVVLEEMELSSREIDKEAERIALERMQQTRTAKLPPLKETA